VGEFLALYYFMEPYDVWMLQALQNRSLILNYLSSVALGYLIIVVGLHREELPALSMLGLVYACESALA